MTQLGGSLTASKASAMEVKEYKYSPSLIIGSVGYHIQSKFQPLSWVSSQLAS